MLLTKLTFGTVTNVSTTGELGGLFLPSAVGYQTAFAGGSSAGFSRKTYATYDEASNYLNPYINKVMVTPPAFGTPCRAATTANISLSGLQTIDGVALIAGDRVLVKNQTTATQNGIYTVSSGSWTRATDSDTGTELQNRIFFQITAGTVNADYYAVIQNTGTITVGTTAISYNLVLDPVFLESQTVYWLRFKGFPATPQYYSTDNYQNPINPKLATTGNITLSGLPIIDGVQTVVFNYVLVKNQTVLSENGLYTVQAGTWDLIDFNISLPWLIYVSSGTVNGGRTFASSRTVAYTPFAVYTNVYTLVSMILYPTLADATAETNALIPAYKTSFNVEWITKPYTPIACVEMAAASVEDIYCCPPPTEYLQTFPDHVELVFPAETVVARLFDPSATYVSTYNGAIYSGINYFVHYEYDAPILCSSVSRTNNRRFFWFRVVDGSGTYQAQLLNYVLGSGANVCAASWTYYSDYYYRVWRSNENYSYEAPVSLPSYAAFDFSQATPHEWTSYNTALSPATFSSNYPVGGAPFFLSFDIQYGQTIPPTITCYLVNAVFQRTTVDLPSGDDIALGTIDVTLTYDAASSTYYGPVENYYNIPGRLSMPAGLLPTVASGKRFLNSSLPFWKVNSSNQIYYEHYLSAGEPSNEIALSYSGYNDARKPQAATLQFYKTDSYTVYTNTNGSLLRSDPTTQTATP